MEAVTILDICRTALRRKSTALDDTELIPLIAAAKSDLAAAGVGIVDDTDPLTQAAIRLYVLWMVGGGDKERQFYEAVKAGMAINSDYAVSG